MRNSGPATRRTALTRRHGIRRIERLPPVSKSPDVIELRRLPAAPLTDETVALENREPKLSPPFMCVKLLALRLVVDTQRTTSGRERPVPAAHPDDRHLCPP